MIRVPNNLFKPKNQNSRLGRVYIYALDAFTIGITPKYFPDWADIALYRKTWKAQREGSNWRIHLPEAVLRFYQIHDPRTKLLTGVNGGNVLITITRGK